MLQNLESIISNVQLDKMPDKCLLRTFQEIRNLMQVANYSVTSGGKHRDLIDSHLRLSPHDGEYLFEARKTIAGRPVATNLPLPPSLTVLTNTEQSLYVQDSDLVVLRATLQFRDVLVEDEFQGQITSFSTEPPEYYNRAMLFRQVLPLQHSFNFKDSYEGISFTVDGKPSFDVLLPLSIDGTEFHVYTVHDEELHDCLIVDSTWPRSIEDFSKTTHSILLAFAFLTGEHHGGTAYIMSYEHQGCETPTSLRMVSLTGGTNNHLPVHFNKPHSIPSLRQEINIVRDEHGRVHIDDSSLEKYKTSFPSDAFAKLCELIATKNGIARAVTLFVGSSTLALEISLPALFVALENVAKALISDNGRTPKLVVDVELHTHMKSVIRHTISQIKKLAKLHKPTNTSQVERKEYDKTVERMLAKIRGFDDGSNNMKLIAPFTMYGYTPSKAEEDLIVSKRNVFLHGHDFILKEYHEEEFEELFFISLRLHKLIAVLLLKASGYSGYILNQAKILAIRPEVTINEHEYIEI